MAIACNSCKTTPWHMPRMANTRPHPRPSIMPESSHFPFTLASSRELRTLVAAWVAIACPRRRGPACKELRIGAQHVTLQSLPKSISTKRQYLFRNIFRRIQFLSGAHRLPCQPHLSCCNNRSAQARTECTMRASVHGLERASPCFQRTKHVLFFK
jgi:hypothetical protein